MQNESAWMGAMTLRIAVTRVRAAWLVIWSVTARGETLGHDHRAFRTPQAARAFAEALREDAAQKAA